MIVDNPDVFSSLNICTRGGFQTDNWEQVLICHVLGSICYCCDSFFFLLLLLLKFVVAATVIGVFFFTSPVIVKYFNSRNCMNRLFYLHESIYAPERVNLKPSLAVGKIIIFILCLMRVSFIDATVYLVKEFRLMTTTRCGHIIIYFDCCNVEGKVLLTINHLPVRSQ